MITLQLADKKGLEWAQNTVEKHHYLQRRVDTRCSPVAYIVRLHEEPAGCLIFGRPEAQRCADWYGSVADVRQGRCRLSRWEVLNLARVYLDPRLQRGNVWCTPELLPGFVDRRGIWHSRAASFIVEPSQRGVTPCSRVRKRAPTRHQSP